ncbi:MAG: SixA phosphatase family protein [Methylococcaceae bacterium]
MKRELWLLRHGKSNRDVVMDDVDRPLKKRGKRAARLMGEWLKQRQLMPDKVLSSPANRAYSTAKIVCEAIGIDNHAIQQEVRLYFQGFEQIKRVLTENAGQSRHILLVGHNPDLEDLLIDLVGKANVPVADKLLPTAAFARIAMPDDWSNLETGCAQLLSITYAKSLSENAD